jgi:hypothetical protein
MAKATLNNTYVCEQPTVFRSSELQSEAPLHWEGHVVFVQSNQSTHQHTIKAKT